MVSENGGHFTNDLFEETEKYIREIQKQKLREIVQHLKQKKKLDIITEYVIIYLSLIEESRQEALNVVFDDVYFIKLVTRATYKLIKQRFCGIQ